MTVHSDSTTLKDWIDENTTLNGFSSRITLGTAEGEASLETSDGCRHRIYKTSSSDSFQVDDMTGFEGPKSESVVESIEPSSVECESEAGFTLSPMKMKESEAQESKKQATLTSKPIVPKPVDGIYYGFVDSLLNVLKPGRFGVFYYNKLENEADKINVCSRLLFAYKSRGGSLIIRPLEHSEKGWRIADQQFYQKPSPSLKNLIQNLKDIGFRIPGNPTKYDHVPFWTLRAPHTVEECSRTDCDKILVPRHINYVVQYLIEP
ncbi:unnamed protein product [Bursaphelenchus okinawaensis]|uniref:Uncharacterized protein n=1 Tax=Bursaphelenchus okinawaensis TaxID=465554 RepID=A0A811KK08_9BILA|nr:unnamed protein product [Bursaphelenchus okinawaensis]CAG9105283.1 unnamed protein product [Bursaphelenchus okinawaensis]